MGRLGFRTFMILCIQMLVQKSATLFSRKQTAYLISMEFYFHHPITSLYLNSSHGHKRWRMENILI